MLDISDTDVVYIIHLVSVPICRPCTVKCRRDVSRQAEGIYKFKLLIVNY